MHEYDLIADWYATERIGPGGVPELESLIAMLPEAATVLDVGCGNGIPLTRRLLAAGCKVVGVDSSPRMLERFEKNCPGTPFICAPIQCADLEAQSFDAAVAWGVIFHLPHDEQRQAIAKVASVLKPGGLFLFTAGDQNGDKEGDPMNGVPFHYWSFGIDGYREHLMANGLTPFSMFTVMRARTSTTSRGGSTSRSSIWKILLRHRCGYRRCCERMYR